MKKKMTKTVTMKVVVSPLHNSIKTLLYTLQVLTSGLH